MITLKEFNQLQEDASTMKAQLEEFRKLDVEAIKAGYETKITELNKEIEMLKTPEAVQATETFKSLVTENENNKTKISELEGLNKELQVNKEDNQKVVNTMVMERLASLGVSPIKVSTENNHNKKKNTFANADEYFSSIK